MFKGQGKLPTLDRGMEAKEFDFSFPCPHSLALLLRGVALVPLSAYNDRGQARRVRGVRSGTRAFPRRCLDRLVRRSPFPVARLCSAACSKASASRSAWFGVSSRLHWSPRRIRAVGGPDSRIAKRMSSLKPSSRLQAEKVTSNVR